VRHSNPLVSTEFVRGLGILAIAAAPVLVSGDWLLGAAAVAAAALLSGAILAATPFPGPDEIDVHLSLRAEDGRRALVTGGAGVLSVRLSNRSPGRGFAFWLVPFLPPGLREKSPLPRSVRMRPGGRWRERFPVRIERVGTVVVPGILITKLGLLGLFRRRRFFPARCEAPLLPDYGRSDHPVVARYLQPGLDVGEGKRQRTVKGTGTEFAEIRDYRVPDSMRRVDWKATARRCRVMVREYEEPREFTVRIVLDGSRDLTEGEDDGAGFARAAGLIGKLAYVAMAQAMNLELCIYDHDILLTHRLGGRTIGLRKLLADVVATPRLALLRAVRGMLSSDERLALATRLHRRTFGRWRGGDRRESLEDLPSRTDPDGKAADGVEYLVDHHPGSIGGLEDRCAECARAIFEDEGTCSACGTPRGPNGLPPRGACLSAVLLGNLRRSRGREMWVVISSLRGGEACEEVARPLELAARNHRQVHVVLPASRPLREIPSTMPVSMGVYPDLQDALTDAEALYSSALVEEFAGRLQGSGIAVHPLRDAAAMEEIVARLILDEVLSR